MTKKTRILLVLAFVLFGIINLAITNQALAGDSGWWKTVSNGGLDVVGNAYTTDEPQDPRIIVSDIIKIILGFLGILAVVLILYAGFKWMLSRGNEEEVSSAKRILVTGVIGLIIILAAFLIANFVINRIYGVVSGYPVLYE